MLVTCGVVTDLSVLSAVSPMARAIPLLASGVGLLAMRLRSTAKELARQGAEASYLAHHDMLTTLPNRRKLEAELFAQAQRGAKSGKRLSAAVINLDRFKDFNDTLGHHAGDSILQGVACPPAELPS